MDAVVDISKDLARRTLAQRRRTMAAIAEGEPRQAASPRQARARSEYMRKRWPRLADAYILEGNVGPDDSLWASFLSRGARCARAVGRVSWAEEPAESRAKGTGFLVADSVLLTNHHVLSSRAMAERCVVEFDYEYDDLGRERRGKVCALEPASLFVADEGLDYALVAVADDSRGNPPGKTRGCLPLIQETGKAQNGESLNLIHHPGGGRKRVTIRESRLLAVDDKTLSYSGDTLGGSSGSPVFNDQWEVVGLHFGGKPHRDSRGRDLTASGELWTPAMPESSRGYEYNVGMRGSRILTHIRERRLTSRSAKALQRSVVQAFER